MFVCLPTPSELGDIAPNMTLGESPKSDISCNDRVSRHLHTGAPLKFWTKKDENRGLHSQNPSETTINRSGINFLTDIVLQKFL